MTAQIGTFPTRLNTVTAEVLGRLLEGESLTGMDAVFGCSTTRLAAVIHYLTAVVSQRSSEESELIGLEIRF